MHWLDKWGERATRSVAHATSRRSVLNRISKLLVGTAFLVPVLPVARSAPAAAKKPQTDDTACDYWRYCAVDGFLCSCCGGSMTSCPPGTSPSAVSWVGTCHNPLDGKDYLISYNDCCGKTACGKCMCAAAERERPGYQMFLHNDVNWCMSNESSIFHCTTSVIVGMAKPQPKAPAKP
nr:methylamine dehydrogenase light chain [uncultured Achromobacter sp.]